MRAPYGAVGHGGHYHSQSVESIYAHIPGIKVYTYCVGVSFCTYILYTCKLFTARSFSMQSAYLSIVVAEINSCVAENNYYSAVVHQLLMARVL